VFFAAKTEAAKSADGSELMTTCDRDLEVHVDSMSDTKEIEKTACTLPIASRNSCRNKNVGIDLKKQGVETSSRARA